MHELIELAIRIYHHYEAFFDMIGMMILFLLIMYLFRLMEELL